jgi:hypothetical protein
MRPLTLDDLLPLDEYAGRRREFFESHERYIDRYRRIRIGPVVTLLFENRQTLWFRLHEILRVARLADPGRVQQELEVYNRLLPGPEHLHAAFLIEVKDEARLSEELSPWQTFRGEDLSLNLGSKRVRATLVTCRPEDLLVGAAHWVGFEVSDENRQLLANFRLPAEFQISTKGYEHESLPLNSEVRQSLLDDLEMSDRD